ncbi:Ribosomal RNA small subunit methyltransferase G [Roseovarius litorisediminis]|uniref:Ribosomal RNA small subunit methyltransferase G n=1 Tax=Roseovarius litorisediminis TaxID=1312363 RepID=A0A1Y5SLE0_9RHOB|nr:16S rRNA (guanine(527)-N(7))-methyltransferase RsmG [Roseovarius litorisediminis]SLN43463.1 Ribosomal RNA small subunit methyltransferase G [Roseovarius litorisediminis]
MITSDGLNVSRETFERLECYAELLRKWNPKINLVSKSTISDLWKRHILDSAQIYDLAPHPVTHWVDLGTGGGFPGMVIAIMAADSGSPIRTTLVESDMRKSTFLRTVIRETGIQADVITKRIEELPPMRADVISARALANLTTLLSFAARHLAPDGMAIFPKGASWEKELMDAQSKWKFDVQVAKSKTEDGPVILSITGVASV